MNNSLEILREFKRPHSIYTKMMVTWIEFKYKCPSCKKISKHKGVKGFRLEWECPNCHFNLDTEMNLKLSVGQLCLQRIIQ